VFSRVKTGKMKEAVAMQKAPGMTVDRKFLIVMVFICLVIGGSFAFIYLDLKANLEALRDDYATLLDQMQQLENLVESQHQNQVANLTTVQIYNQTKYSVVLIACTLPNGSGVEGSGFVYDDGGHIVTNNHVVEGAASITVAFYNGTSVHAQLTGSDIYSDLAVIKVDSLPEHSHALILGNSTQLLVGEPVYAIGNPFGLRGSMTSGIVSQMGRVLRLSDFGVPPPQGNYAIADVIQIDAAINPGNSGGPLLDSLGFVVGVTFAIETGGEVRAFVGVGYAIPSVLVKRVANAIIATGSYTHPWLGISYDANYVGGLLISSVNSTGPAATAGLLANDVITKVDEQSVTRPEDLLVYIERYKSPNDVISLDVLRGSTVLYKKLILDARP
jgi:S1-C subfamily serine protease